jgi:hypothetical protein
MATSIPLRHMILHFLLILVHSGCASGESWLVAWLNSNSQFTQPVLMPVFTRTQTKSRIFMKILLNPDHSTCSFSIQDDRVRAGATSHRLSTPISMPMCAGKGCQTAQAWQGLRLPTKQAFYPGKQCTSYGGCNAWLGRARPGDGKHRTRSRPRLARECVPKQYTYISGWFEDAPICTESMNAGRTAKAQERVPLAQRLPIVTLLYIHKAPSAVHIMN